MRKLIGAILFLTAGALGVSALPAHAAPGALPGPAQTNCANDNLGKGEGKFTGQISGGPNGSLIEVTSGNETALVHYTNSSVLVCEGGAPAPVNRLTTGATVVVYGPMKKKGKITDINAVKILVAGSTQSSAMTGDSMSSNYNKSARGGTESASLNSGSSASQMSSSNAVQTGSMLGSQKTSNTQNSGSISCNALLFTVNSADVSSGHVGVHAASVITCKKPVDQLALQLTDDALTRRRLSSVTLNWQNQLEATMANAEITSVQFLSDNGTQVVEITYSSQKAEITYMPSGTHISF